MNDVIKQIITILHAAGAVQWDLQGLPAQSGGEQRDAA